MERDRNISGDRATAASRDTGNAAIPFGRIRPMASAPSGSVRPGAAFIAHLIAANENVPQLRVLRRDDPGVASAAYLKAAGQSQPDHRPSRQRTISLTIV